jgi:4-amino-4-deoxy-L-arabinose transferase-like glycosyltransferase
MKLRHELALVVLLLLIAAPSRLLGLDQLPPGLFHDEAYEGIDAARILAGARPVFLAENFGREPLYAYVMAAFISIGGQTAAAVRATSALFGLLAIPTAYFWARAFFGPHVGLLTAALTASCYWVLHESRLGMRPIALPVFLAMTSGLAWIAARRGRMWAWPLAGVFLGLTLYTYLPARLFPLVIIGQVLVGWGGRRPAEQGSSRRADVIGLAVLALVAAIVALPLLLHFRAHPGDAMARAAAVSVLASDDAREEPQQTVARSLFANLGMFVWRGDEDSRHNFSGRPVFDWLIAPFFLVGALFSLRHLARPEHAALWLWLVVMLVPGVLSDSAPHFLRSIGILPAVLALPALGLMKATSALMNVHTLELGRRWRLAMGSLVTVLIASQCLTWRDYFLELPRQPHLEERFDAGRAALAEVAGDPPDDLDVQLPPPGWSHPTIRFLRPRSFVVPTPRQPTRVRFAANAVLLGYDLESPPASSTEAARLTLYWQALREMNASYLETVRIVDALGRVWWQRQGVPGSGTLPTDTWALGEYVADRARLELDHGAPAGEYELEIWLTQPDGGRPLPVFDQSGRQIGRSVRLPITVQ